MCSAAPRTDRCGAQCVLAIPERCGVCPAVPVQSVQRCVADRRLQPAWHHGWARPLLTSSWRRCSAGVTASCPAPSGERSPASQRTRTGVSLQCVPEYRRRRRAARALCTGAERPLASGGLCRRTVTLVVFWPPRRQADGRSEGGETSLERARPTCDRRPTGSRALPRERARRGRRDCARGPETRHGGDAPQNRRQCAVQCGIASGEGRSPICAASG